MGYNIEGFGLGKLSGVLLFGVGGAFLVLALAFVTGYELRPGPMGFNFVYGTLFGFLAFFLIGYGLSMILKSKK
ncbi:MAG: hypothetical protein ACFFDE_00295 [Promethearchaeota archaeon]